VARADFPLYPLIFPLSKKSFDQIWDKNQGKGVPSFIKIAWKLWPLDRNWQTDIQTFRQTSDERINSLSRQIGDNDEGDNDFTEFHSVINCCHPFITLWNSVKSLSPSFKFYEVTEETLQWNRRLRSLRALSKRLPIVLGLRDIP